VLIIKNFNKILSPLLFAFIISVFLHSWIIAGVELTIDLQQGNLKETTNIKQTVRIKMVSPQPEVDIIKKLSTNDKSINKRPVLEDKIEPRVIENNSNRPETDKIQSSKKKKIKQNIIKNKLVMQEPVKKEAKKEPEKEDEKKFKMFDSAQFTENLIAEKSNSATKTEEEFKKMHSESTQLEKRRERTIKIQHKKTQVEINGDINDKDIINNHKQIIDFTADNKGIKGAKKPKITFYQAPLYPEKLRRRNIEGRVILKLTINQQGKLMKIKVFESSGYKLFDQAAVKVIKDWKFRPALYQDEKIVSVISLPIRFKLKE